MNFNIRKIFSKTKKSDIKLMYKGTTLNNEITDNINNLLEKEIKEEIFKSRNTSIKGNTLYSILEEKEEEKFIENNNILEEKEEEKFIENNNIKNKNILEEKEEEKFIENNDIKNTNIFIKNTNILEGKNKIILREIIINDFLNFHYREELKTYIELKNNSVFIYQQNYIITNKVIKYNIDCYVKLKIMNTLKKLVNMNIFRDINNNNVNNNLLIKKVQKVNGYGSIDIEYYYSNHTNNEENIYVFDEEKNIKFVFIEYLLEILL